MKWWKKRPKVWINWRTRVYKRDGYKCIWCGKGWVRLDPHHIIPKSLLPKLKYIVSNGCSLCRKCHKKTFKKELDFVELFVTILYGDIKKWKLLKHWKMLKRKKIGSKEL